MAKTELKSKARKMQLVIFRLRDEEFGVEISSVLEISRVLDITHIPEAPGFIEGVINLRGKVLAVIALAKQFGLQEEKELPKTARIVIIEVHNISLGLIVDEVPEVIKISEEDIEPTPEIIQSEVNRHYIKGVAKLDQRLIILLDLNNVLSFHEVEEAAKVAKIVET